MLIPSEFLIVWKVADDRCAYVRCVGEIANVYKSEMQYGHLKGEENGAIFSYLCECIRQVVQRTE